MGNPIGNLYRKNHVLVLVGDGEGNFILGKKKDFYPNHISRMIGGGVKEAENPSNAAQRETKEEFGLDIPVSEFKPLCVVNTLADTTEGHMEMQTSIYFVAINKSQTIKPSDDISGIETYSQAAYENLIRAMEQLTGKFVTEKYSFEWKDWGKVYAPIHRLALENLRTKA
ncbi:MAG: NUDIX hydrolase [bacterium]|nr:NUDIX hydrolase [bacterium]